jgi:hypothetical protein
MAEASLGHQGGAAIDKILNALRLVSKASVNIKLRESTDNPVNVEVKGYWVGHNVIRIDIEGDPENLQELLK